MAPDSPRRALAGLLVFVGGTSLAAWLGGAALERRAGLALTVCPATVPCETSSYRLAATPLNRGFLKRWPQLADSRFEARYDGYWWVEESGPRVVGAFTDGSLVVRLDGESLLTCDAASVQVERHITAGLHRLHVSWSYSPGSSRFRLRQGSVGEELHAFAPESLHATRPSAAEVAVRWTLHRIWRALGFAWAALGVGLAVLLGAGVLRRPWGIRVSRSLLGGWPPWARRAAPRLALGLILAYGTALRLDALLERLWAVDPPAALAAVHPLLDAVRPESLWWAPETEPYRHGDPIAYLRHARRMSWPYDPSPREPAFVVATRAGLYLTGDRDVGVSVASLVSSVLLLLGTYMLGRDAFSRPVGLAAALALALDTDAIQQSTEGFRDDLFAFWVVVFLWRLLKLYRESTFANAVWLGLAGGLTGLTRLTAFTLLIPTLTVMVVVPRNRRLRERAERVAVAAGLAAALVVPFMLATALASGDPLESINMHVEFLRVRDEQTFEPGMGLFRYLTTSFAPVRLTDMVLGGFTYYPFSNKWRFEHFSRILGPLLAGSTLIAMPLLLTTPQGRLLLLGHVSVMLPFTFTWETFWGNPWRHTLHAYPIYLIAAFSLWRDIARLLFESRRREALRRHLSLRRVLGLAAGLVAAVSGLWWLSQWLYFARVREAIELGQTTHVTAGPRDSAFFVSGWERPTWRGNFYTRRTRGREATIRLPLVPGNAHWITLRIEPVVEGDEPAEVQVDLKLDAANLKRLDLVSSPERMASVPLSVPATMVRGNPSELSLVIREGRRVEIWYVYVQAVSSRGAPEAAAPAPDAPRQER